MSGICGLFNLDGNAVADADLRSMTALLEARGPERTGTWQKHAAGLGHTLLATTPELQFERQPLEHAETGCVITADVRLDNRDELAAVLDVPRPLDVTGDAELILLAYLRWGDACVDRLLGDFAFAIWDPRSQNLLCARDQFGMRPFYYHHAARQRFVFASDARAMLVLPAVPFEINEGRIADFLVPELEWYDYTSSFYNAVFRLAPGHRAVVSRAGIAVDEYYRVQPGPDPGRLTDDQYREGFVEVFNKAIDARLRSPPGTVGSMLSGGLDSGSVVAFGRDLHEQRGAGPLPTFSGVRKLEDETEEVAQWSETRSIQAAITMSSITPTLVHPEDTLEMFGPLSSGFEEPFDGVFAMLKTLFLTAHGRGLKALLDGGGGDILMNEGSYIVRLIRGGHVKQAIAEIAGEAGYSGNVSIASSAMRYFRSALLPDLIKRKARALRNPQRLRGFLSTSLIAPEFAQRIGIAERYEQMLAIFPNRWTPDYAVEFCNRVRPNMTGGRERYARIAAATGMEARDPFLDKRLVEYCARLPGHLKMRDGWPKAILRDVTTGSLPDSVRWSRRKQHLGYWFLDAVTRQAFERGELDPASLAKQLNGFVDANALARAWRIFEGKGSSEAIHYAYILATWLLENSVRPVVSSEHIL